MPNFDELDLSFEMNAPLALGGGGSEAGFGPGGEDEWAAATTTNLGSRLDISLAGSERDDESLASRSLASGPDEAPFSVGAGSDAGSRRRTNESTIEIRRGPLLFSYPVNGTANVTSLNATMVERTSVERIPNASFGIALENPNASALAFSGFGALNAVVPFDRARPPATITARARMTTGNVQVNYEKNGMPPPSPVKAEDCNGTAFDVELVPMAHTHLRLTVLPVLENAIGA